MTSRKNSFGRAAQGRTLFSQSFETLLQHIDFPSAEEAIKTENEARTAHAFRGFMRDMRWCLAPLHFDALLAEKSGEFSLRKDCRTPNWYHEFRNILGLCSQINNGRLIPGKLADYGDLETAVCIALRHDSIEDHGKDYEHFLEIGKEASIEARLNRCDKTDIHAQTDQIYNGVERLSRKVARLNPDGTLKRDAASGKVIKDFIDDREDVNAYINAWLCNPWATLVKYGDAVEGIVTRADVDAMKLESHFVYVAERRQMYGARNTEADAISRYPYLKKAVLGMDGMLGIGVMGLETYLHFQSPGQNPKNAPPLRLTNYIRNGAAEGYKGLPPAWNPLCLLMEGLEARARRNPRIGTLLEHAFYPAMETIYSKPLRNGSMGLPQAALSAPNI